jgi:transmembrane sensor
MSTDYPAAEEPLPTEAIEAAAAVWLSLRDRGMTPEETTRFVQWLQQDSRNAEIFGVMDRTWQEFDQLAVVPAANAGPCDPDLLAPRQRRRTPQALRWSRRVASAAAAVFVLLLAYHYVSRPGQMRETQIGAFEKVDLPDGSVAQLNTNSAIAVAFTASERRVLITRGEVYFSVLPDPERPFVVSTGPVRVRAVGTAFNVHRRESAIEVLVTEGSVQVEEIRSGRSVLAVAQSAETPPLVVAGERAVVQLVPGGHDAARARAIVESLSAPEVQRALAWQERRLEFDAAPLAEVVREFNRYNRQQLVIADEHLASRRFSGTFRADGYRSLVRLLEQDFGVRATESHQTIVLHGGR